MSKLLFKDNLYIKGRIGWQALKKDEYLNKGDYYLVTGVDIKDDHSIDFSSCYYVSEERYKKDEKIQLKEGDIILTKDGTIGKIGYIDHLDKPATLNSHLFVIRSIYPEKINSRYLFYLLQTNLFSKYAKSNTTGSNIPAFTQKDFSDFSIEFPEISVQKKISVFLSLIDKKISVNNQINDNLSKLAKELYDYWFVQFDFPNEEGKPYKSSGGKMVWNKDLKKEIPEAWEVKKIENTDIYNSDYTANGSFAGLAENVKYYDKKNYARLIRIIDENNNYDDTKSIYLDQKGYEYLSSCQLEGGEIIICNVGNAGFTFRCPPLEEKMALGPNGIVVKHSEMLNYLYLYFISENGQHQLKSISSGSIQSKFNKTNFRSLSLAIPPKQVTSRFDQVITPYFQQIDNLWKNNRILVNLKKFLLPLLMNGQVTIKN